MAEVKPPTAPRKRGRPRTNVDEHVPEKRRQQLREAQQTYRRRKETTINTLQARVQELESGIEELSQSFLSFSTLLLSENLLDGRPRITSALQSITQQCVSLAKQGSSDTEQSVAEDKEKTSNPSSSVEKVNLEFDMEIARHDPVLYSGNTTPSLTSLASWTNMSLPRTPPSHDQALPFDFTFSGSMGPLTSLPSPPITISPSDIAKEGRFTLSQRIVLQCCRNGYKLLVHSPDNSARIRQVFGGPVTEPERARLVSWFYNAMNDDYGDMLESRTTVLSPMYPKKLSYSAEQLAQSSRSWQLVYEGGGDWLDANGVHRLLLEKGIDIQPDGSPNSVFRMNSSLLFDVSSFVKLLAGNCVCVGNGPAFKKTTVEKVLLLATSTDPWAYDSSIDVPGFNF
ncbi:hypothetical protein N7520_006728 [Penicillium odoratum]|uniref:uncharacterized protein n=1 Tax=Penicillium odoratum TaxID=1167516 RepID=UPI002546EA9D|nr:uncharacterized protein N7520_006728 [Penicillium odoratum]KAJ5759572.1 hypothetical protein N7520_006728 [Penicillium odoratum]